jgi:hypothetical protein
MKLTTKRSFYTKKLKEITLTWTKVHVGDFKNTIAMNHRVGIHIDENPGTDQTILLYFITVTLFFWSIRSVACDMQNYYGSQTCFRRGEMEEGGRTL